jgi:hypothetical protein
MVKENIADSDGVEAFLEAQTPEHAAICRRLFAEIRRGLPRATARLYHGSPAWFVGENVVVGVSVKVKAGVTLLFWNGRAFKDKALTPVGQFEAAEISFQTAGQIDKKMLSRLLKKAGTDLWDFAGIRKKRRAVKKR